MLMSSILNFQFWYCAVDVGLYNHPICYIPFPKRFICFTQLISFYERFTLFYADRHQGRKLNWLIQLSKGELKTGYLSQEYTLTVSTFQMGILLQFNDQSSFTFAELLQGTSLSDEVLSPNLQLLCKAKILIKDQNYSLNFDFKSKKLRINLNVGIKSEAKQESLDMVSSVEKDRELVVQAAIVRIMKTRKVLKHVQLVQEVIQQLQSRFQPKVSAIKKCIDILLEKEYLDRVSGQIDMFSYVA
jgi:cullin 1